MLFKSDIWKCVLPPDTDLEQVHDGDVASVTVHKIPPPFGILEEDAQLLSRGADRETSSAMVPGFRKNLSSNLGGSQATHRNDSRSLTL
jgi:hypothetical protein